MKEEMYIDAPYDEYVCVSYTPENKSFPVYREHFSQNKKVSKYEKQR